MKNTYKLALLSGTIFSRNMGCNALTYGSLEILSCVADKLQVDFEYYLVGNPPAGAVPDELGKYNIRLLERLPDFGVKNVLRGLYRNSLKTELELKNTYGDMDIFLDNAWGDSFSDIYGEERFNEVMHQLNFALNSGAPLVLLPQTIGPFKDALLHSQVKKVLNSACAVYVRDPLSSNCAKELVPDLDVFETTDVALFMGYDKRSAANRGGLTIGINPSGLLWSGGYTGDNQFGLKDDYRVVLKSVVKYLLSIEGVSVELVGHDIKGPNAGNIEDDYFICKLIQKEFPACTVAPFFYSPIEAKSYISGLDMLIGSRMHCCLAAYSSGVPVFPLAYSRKFKGLFADRLDYPYLSELTEDSLEKVTQRLSEFVSSLDQVRSNLSIGVERISRQKSAVVDDLAIKLGRVLLK